MSNRRQIEQRVIQAAESALYRQHYVSPLDVLLCLTTALAFLKIGVENN